MKRKELNNLAKKIAKCEMIIQTSENPKEVQAAELEVMKLTSHVDNLNDLDEIDEIVQDILSKNI